MKLYVLSVLIKKKGPNYHVLYTKIDQRVMKFGLEKRCQTWLQTELYLLNVDGGWWMDGIKSLHGTRSLKQEMSG